MEKAILLFENINSNNNREDSRRVREWFAGGLALTCRRLALVSRWQRNARTEVLIMRACSKAIEYRKPLSNYNCPSEARKYQKEPMRIKFGCLAFLTLRLFRAASAPIIVCTIIINFSFLYILGWKKNLKNNKKINLLKVKTILKREQLRRVGFSLESYWLRGWRVFSGTMPWRC